MKQLVPGLCTVLVIIVQGVTSSIQAAPPPKVSHTYVRGVDTNGNMSVAFYDEDLPVILKKGPYTAVDIVMQQCHSGGFMQYLVNNPPGKDWTFTSSCAANETANNMEDIALLAFDYIGLVDNFTRSWREDAQYSPPFGMKQHYLTTVNGNATAKPAILQDRYAPGAAPTKYLFIDGSVYYIITGTFQGVTGQYIWAHYNDGFGGSGSGWFQVKPTGENIKYGKKMVPSWTALKGAYGVEKDTPYPQFTSETTTEHPQYASAGAASDQRVLGVPTPNPSNVQQYAILVQWDVPNRSTETTTTYAYSYSVNMDRVINTLTSTYNVSTDNIVALYFNGTFGKNTRLPAYGYLYPGTSGNLLEDISGYGPIDGPSGTNDGGQGLFADLAVPGKLFKKNGAPGTLPGTNAHLLVYFTGHGGTTTDAVKLKYKPDPSLEYQLLPSDSVNPDGTPDAPGFDAVSELNAAIASFLATTNDPTDLPSDGAIFSYASNVLDGFQGVGDLIQINTTVPIPSYAQLVINGLTNTSSPLTPANPNTATLYDLDPLVPGLLTNTYTYQVMVDSTVLNEGIPEQNAEQDVNQGTIDIQFAGLQPTDFNPNLVKAFIVRGQDEEVAYLPPDITVTTNVTAQDIGGGMLLTWPPGATNYLIQENSDLTTTNWVTVTSPVNLAPEITGQADLTLPMGTNWAFFAYTNSQMFFRLAPSQ